MGNPTPATQCCWLREIQPHGTADFPPPHPLLHPFLMLAFAICRQVSFGLCPPAMFPSQHENACAAVSWSWKVCLGRGGGWGTHRGHSSSWATTVTSAVTSKSERLCSAAGERFYSSSPWRSSNVLGTVPCRNSHLW